MPSNCIGDYFGEANVKAAMHDYIERNGMQQSAVDTLMTFAQSDQNKIIDIVCNYLDRNQLHKLQK